MSEAAERSDADPDGQVRVIAGKAPDSIGGLRSKERRKLRLVSVVIPALNTAEHLESQLSALAAQDYAGVWEVVVADNGSIDSTASVAGAWVNRLPGSK